MEEMQQERILRSMEHLLRQPLVVRQLLLRCTPVVASICHQPEQSGAAWGCWRRCSGLRRLPVFLCAADTSENMNMINKENEADAIQNEVITNRKKMHCSSCQIESLDSWMHKLFLLAKTLKKCQNHSWMCKLSLIENINFERNLPQA